MNQKVYKFTEYQLCSAFLTEKKRDQCIATVLNSDHRRLVDSLATFAIILPQQLVFNLEGKFKYLRCWLHIAPLPPTILV